MTDKDSDRPHSTFQFEKSPRACRIICTIGPSSSSRKTLEKMLLSGMNIARLNFSHGSHASHGEIVRTLREAAHKLMRPIAILQDLQGHKVRVGQVQNATTVRLEEGQKIHVGYGQAVTAERISIDYPEIGNYVLPGQHIFFDDGSIELEVLTTHQDDLLCQVNLGGELGSRKGVIFPESQLIPISKKFTS